MSLAAIDALLQDSRRGVTRLTPKQAAAALQDGALLIDTRPSEHRRRDGEIPGSIVIDRNVMEWRLDPSSQNPIPQLLDREAQTEVIIINAEAAWPSTCHRCHWWISGVGRVWLERQHLKAAAG